MVILKDDRLGQEGCKTGLKVHVSGGFKRPSSRKEEGKENQMARPTLLLPYPTSTHVSSHTRLSKLGPDISWIEKPADCGPVRSQIGNCCQRKWLVFSNSIIKKKKKEEEEEEEKGSSKLLDDIFPLESKANFLT
ncbi:hypothetical protein HZH66_006820 [Vespula vulgaris]|uniref:Uncharacterized protein n=1 Tax=Vespula vulgaris TaxID=7454 RepID=A0A834K2H3_VESVU|nr:hypothetical protein HZH66_006820 [Vespula vulgaris]